MKLFLERSSVNVMVLLLLTPGWYTKIDAQQQHLLLRSRGELTTSGPQEGDQRCTSSDQWKPMMMPPGARCCPRLDGIRKIEMGFLGRECSSNSPSVYPSAKSSLQPSISPSIQPSNQPSLTPSTTPSYRASFAPSVKPSVAPSTLPTNEPTNLPSNAPSSLPSKIPSTEPSHRPSLSPSTQPSSTPSFGPSTQPSLSPSSPPSMAPSGAPSNQPSLAPSTTTPSIQPPSLSPSTNPSTQPLKKPSGEPTNWPSLSPSEYPSNSPSLMLSIAPSPQPNPFPRPPSGGPGGSDYPREGTPVICGPRQINVYRFTLTPDGEPELRWYPRTDIADSWDPDWEPNRQIINCREIPFGKEMKLAPPEGTPVQCNTGDIHVYCFTLAADLHPELKLYPTSSVAESWNPDWLSTRQFIGCSGVSIGRQLGFAPPEGSPVNCSPGDIYTYRITKTSNRDPKLRLYPRTDIASSWDPDWVSNRQVIDCSGIPLGQNMKLAPPEGTPVNCSTGDIYTYRFTLRADDHPSLRWYPTPAIADSWDCDWRTTKRIIPCSGVPVGTQLDFAPIAADGTPVICSPTAIHVYRFTWKEDLSAELRLYPTPAIADSWDPDWIHTREVISCTGIPIGPMMGPR